MLLQIYFRVSEANGRAFEEMFEKVYLPAMQVQEGYLGSRLLPQVRQFSGMSVVFMRVRG